MHTTPSSSSPSALPVLFVPHGSPMFALHPGAAGAALRDMSARLPRARAVLVISPHWETTQPTVTGGAHLDTIHDFGGFDLRLFDIQYPSQGSPALAEQVVAALQDAGLAAEVDLQRGLDHGAWVPLRHMFPTPSLPTVALSVQHHGGPAHAHRVGRALAPLREQGVLIVASGNITHSLRDWQHILRTGAPTPDYVQRFADWVHAHLTAKDTAALLDYRQLSADGRLAHPRDEHLLPLFTAWGAAGEQAEAHAFFRGISDHVIAMDGYVFH